MRLKMWIMEVVCRRTIRMGPGGVKGSFGGETPYPTPQNGPNVLPLVPCFVAHPLKGPSGAIAVTQPVSTGFTAVFGDKTNPTTRAAVGWTAGGPGSADLVRPIFQWDPSTGERCRIALNGEVVCV
jgi:hypothetical protein